MNAAAESGKWRLGDGSTGEMRRQIADAVAGLIGDATVGALYYELEWRFCNQPDWTNALLFLRDGPGGCTGFAPFFRQERPLNFFLGEIKLFSAPIRRYTLLGEPLLSAANPENASNAIAGMLHSARRHLSGAEALFFEGLPVQGPAHDALTTLPEVERDYILVPIERPFEHQFINMPPSYEDFLKDLGSRSRKSLQYSERKLERDMDGDVSVRCFESPEDVERFLIDAEEISRKTYQRNLLGLGLEASPAFKRRLEFAADRGWLRSYILYCRSVPAAFMLGYQHRGCYYYTDVGYDPHFAEWSVGSVLQLKVMQHLYAADNRPSRFDFSTGYGTHKARFGNFQRTETNLLLLPRTLRNRLLVFAHRATTRAGDAIVNLTERLGVKARLKRWIRRSSVR
jgi:CelD/BcsL family acetyltransferase involved in cellulose biosynthesis